MIPSTKHRTAIVVLLLAGCTTAPGTGPTETPDAGQEGPLPDAGLAGVLPEPWESLARAWNIRVASCGFAPDPDVAAFIEGLPPGGAAREQLRASLQDPSLTPDETKAGPCLEDLARQPCGESFMAWGTPACLQLFKGNLPPGSNCGPAGPYGKAAVPFLGDPCAPLSRCQSPTGGCGTCVPVGECFFDDDCPAPAVCRLHATSPSGHETYACLAPIAEGAPCELQNVAAAPCGNGLICDSANTICRAPTAAGGACNLGSDCGTDARCLERTCRPLGHDGDACPVPATMQWIPSPFCAPGLMCFPDLRCHPYSERDGALCSPGEPIHCGLDALQLGLACDAATHTCQKALSLVENGACGGNAVCLHATTTRMCLDNTCQDRAGPGGACRGSDGDCRSGLVCGPDAANTYVCEAGLNPGEACVLGGVPCVSGTCRNGTCPQQGLSCP